MSDQMERRDFIQRVGILAGTAAAATLVEQPAFAQTGAKPMTYEPKRLSLDPKSIKGIPRRLPGGGQSLCSTCTSMPITWTTVPQPRVMSTFSWRPSAGTMR
jgi:hypothetical protein